MRLIALLTLTFLPASAQVASRASAIEAERDKKQAELQPEVNSALEKRLIWIKDGKVLERLSAGIYGITVLTGGMATGQGFAIGPAITRRDLFGGKAQLHANYQMSTSASTKGELLFTLPEIFNDRVSWQIGAQRHNYNRLDYFGPGPESEETGRSNYRYEDVAFDTSMRFRAGRHFYVGPNIGGVLVNVGPGKYRHVISTERQFAPGQAPGLGQQTDFIRPGVYAGFDWRDFPAGPRAGGLYGAIYDYYKDVGLKQHDFHQLKLRAEQFIPFFNKRRVIALRLNSKFTWTRDGQTVPFYFQPVLGGSDDLRGYRSYRFYGDNSMLMNAEYRWEVFAGMDAAIFADAGKVFMHKDEFNLKNLESAVGFGVRFNVRNATFLRMDVGFSHEGFMVWLKFSDVFVKKPVGISSPEHIY